MSYSELAKIAEECITEVNGDSKNKDCIYYYPILRTYGTKKRTI